MGHIGFAISNGRALARVGIDARALHQSTAGRTDTRYFQHVNRYSASFALAADIAMLALGGYLKKKETLSARLGDVLSAMYLASMVLKHHDNQGRERPICVVEWACRSLLYSTGTAAPVLAQFPQSSPGRGPAAAHLPARTHLFSAKRRLGATSSISS